MRPRSSKGPKISRRVVLQWTLAPAVGPFGPESFTPTHPFESWHAERQMLEAALDFTPEDAAPAARERLFDRVFQLERQILTTPSVDLPAMRAKAAMLVWLMEMEQADGLFAMKQIASFLDGLD